MAGEAGLRVERLALWGTPFLSGHAGFRLLGRMLPAGLCVAFEKLPERHAVAKSFALR